MADLVLVRTRDGYTRFMDKFIEEAEEALILEEDGGSIEHEWSFEDVASGREFYFKGSNIFLYKCYIPGQGDIFFENNDIPFEYDSFESELFDGVEVQAEAVDDAFFSIEYLKYDNTFNKDFFIVLFLTAVAAKVQIIFDYFKCVFGSGSSFSMGDAAFFPLAYEGAAKNSGILNEAGKRVGTDWRTLSYGSYYDYGEALEKKNEGEGTLFFYFLDRNEGSIC